MKAIQKRLFTGIAATAACLCLAACQPSDEKIAQAQEKYAQLTQTHNQVVEAHTKVEDDSLDEELVALQEKTREMERYNLVEMKDDEIDELIRTMDSLISDYEEYRAALSGIKGEEEAAVITSITLALVNETEFFFSGLKLYEKGDNGTHVNILEELETFSPQQSLTGLIIQRDVDHTPWILVLTDEEGGEFQTELPVGEYQEEGVSLAVSWDGEQNEITVNPL